MIGVEVVADAWRDAAAEGDGSQYAETGPGMPRDTDGLGVAGNARDRVGVAVGDGDGVAFLPCFLVPCPCCGVVVGYCGCGDEVLVGCGCACLCLFPRSVVIAAFAAATPQRKPAKTKRPTSATIRRARRPHLTCGVSALSPSDLSRISRKCHPEMSPCREQRADHAVGVTCTTMRRPHCGQKRGGSSISRASHGPWSPVDRSAPHRPQ